MRLSHVLIIAAASFLFASEAIAVATDSEITVARDSLSQRRLRSYSKPAKEDDSDDSAKRGFTAEADDESDEERSIFDRFTTEQLERLSAKATELGVNFDHIKSGNAKLSPEKLQAWQTHLNIIIDERKSAKIAKYNAGRLARHPSHQ